jgi:ornithine carbamoyltransferase
MADAFKGADVVYPKSWAPFSVMKERTRLLKKKDVAGLEKLEKETLANNAKFKNWACTEKMMKLTKNGKALYMHCLPADITGLSCKEGEVDRSVFARYRKETYIEASYKPFVIASMILLTQYGEKTSEVLKKIIKRDQKLAL